jgi:GntR family transcriptional repressor for pyruvate dehydrogenase complex
MPFTKVEAEKLSHSVIQQIELLILRGILRASERLPSERELAERLGVSRPSLREAIAELQSRGLLVSKPNAGIFVAEVLGSAFSPALIQLFASYEEAVVDYTAFRRDMEGLAAERAAKYGSEYDLQVIEAIFEKMMMAHQKHEAADEADLDVSFHMAIFEASHNVVMLHMMRSMYDLLRQGVFYNREVMFKNHLTRDQLLDQHRAIKDAILHRQPDAARHAVSIHMDFVEKSMAEHIKAQKNQLVAQQRLNRLQSM